MAGSKEGRSQGREGWRVGMRMGFVRNGNVSILKAPPVPQSDYQRGLDAGLAVLTRLTVDTVRYWSDYSRVLYHPKSSIQINDYELNSTLLPFERWESGEELFTGMDHEVDLLDRDLRGWAEECDALQGIQFVAGADDAWGGFATRYVERVRDEFGKLGIWVWGLEEGKGNGFKAKQMLRTVNAARSIYEISSHASLYMPLAIPSSRLPSYVQLSRGSLWQTSALLSTALESMTLPSRLRPGGGKRGRLDDMEAALNVNGSQRIANVQMSITDPSAPKHKQLVDGRTHDGRMRGSNTNGQLNEDQFLARDASLDMDFFCGEAPATSTNVRAQKPERVQVFGHVESVRGNLGNTGDTGRDQDEEEDEVGYTRKRRRLAALPLIEKYHSRLRFPLLDSFPDIIDEQSKQSQMIDVQASLSTTSRVSGRVKSLQKVVGTMVGVEEREALANGLGEIGEHYEEGWISGSDDDSDD